MPWYKLLFYIVITAPYFLFLLHCMFGSERPSQPRSERWRDLPDEVSGFIQSDKLAKIERAQR